MRQQRQRDRLSAVDGGPGAPQPGGAGPSFTQQLTAQLMPRRRAHRRGGALAELQASGFPAQAPQGIAARLRSRLRALLPLPMPTVSEYICDSDLLPEERHAQPHYFTPKLRGVNLGGWLVVQPWITPSLFYQFEDQPPDKTAMDMYSFCKVLGPIEGNRQLREHWRKWVTEEDLQRLASQGVNTLRVPVGDWMWESYEPYTGCTNGSLAELRRVLRISEAVGLRVLVDLHGARARARAQRDTRPRAFVPSTLGLWPTRPGRRFTTCRAAAAPLCSPPRPTVLSPRAARLLPARPRLLRRAPVAERI